jgi:uncharacterized protein (TIGR03790 family)
MMRLLLFFTIALAACARAEDGSAVVVVYNSKMPASKKVAEHYAEKRSVPARQVIGLPMPEKEAITREEYKTQLEEPFLRKLDELKLFTWKAESRTNAAGKVDEIKAVIDPKIRYAALCFGVPLKIEADTRLNEPGLENARPENRRNEAAVDNELAVLPLHYAGFPIGGPVLNRLYAVTNQNFINPTNGILMVARLDGPTPEIAAGLVDKALQAERDGLWGRGYFDGRGVTNSSYKVGDDMITASERSAAHYGFETTLDEQSAVFPASYPMSHIALYVGWYEFNITGAMARPTVEFMPGAFAYHLHSFNAQTIRSTTERWAGPLLARGAAATMGSTEEPYLEGTPDISVFLSRWLFLGYSFGEAAYASMRYVSWQTTVIGDPLYRPFAMKQKDRHEQLEKSKSKLIEWSYLGVANINLATGKSLDELIPFLRGLPEIKTSSILNEKLGDLLKDKGKWIEAMEPYERALTLNPSPQQRLRLSLVVTPLQENFGHGKEAYAIYQSLLRDYPDYPDKLRIYQKILPLADQFGKPAEAAEYQKALKELTPPPGTPKP